MAHICIETNDEPKVVFVLRKRILQTRMRSHPVGLLPYFMCANSEGSGETVRMLAQELAQISENQKSVVNDHCCRTDAYFTCSRLLIHEPRHEKKQKQNECAPSEDTDQPGHPPSLIRVFAVRIKKAWVLSYPLSEDSDQTGRMPRLIWGFAGRTVTLLVLSCRGSMYVLNYLHHAPLLPNIMWNHEIEVHWIPLRHPIGTIRTKNWT